MVAKNLGLEVIGVSFHVGSGCESADSFQDAIKNARFVFDLGLQLGFNMRLLDLGGGWPGTSNPKVSFEQMARAVSAALDVYFPEEDDLGNKSSVEVIAEPGRYYVASAFVLATMVIAKRVMTLEDGNRGVMYYMNDGVYGSFNCTIFDHWVVEGIPFISESSRKQREVLPTTLWGPTCDSMDLILKGIQLPEMEVGEWLVFKEMGAYTIAAASTFNGFQIPSMKFFVPLHSLESLKRLQGWPSIARVLDIQDDEGMISCSESEEEDAFCADFEHALIAVH
jgi:diaminopimelate decarboxylase